MRGGGVRRGGAQLQSAVSQLWASVDFLLWLALTPSRWSCLLVWLCLLGGLPLNIHRFNLMVTVHQSSIR